jgi:hypothetical protein
LFWRPERLPSSGPGRCTPSGRVFHSLFTSSYTSDTQCSFLLHAPCNRLKCPREASCHTVPGSLCDRVQIFKREGTMHQMIPHPPDGPATRFHCSNCCWTFHIQYPLTPESGLHWQHALAKKWYASHSCLQFANRLAERPAAFQQEAG